jgi:hypothetical protein
MDTVSQELSEHLSSYIESRVGVFKKYLLAALDNRDQCKGTGTINGVGNHSFTLTVVDEQTHGGGGFKKLRIKILDRATLRTIYDNNLGYPDNTAPTTVISGGSIDIHIKREGAGSNGEEPSN